MNRALWAAVLACSAGARAGPLDSLQAGQWYDVPNSHLSAQDPCPQRNCSYSGASGQASVVSAWSSAAYDSSRDRLIVWGGGHGDYGGNELYAFDLGTLTWSRLTSPSDPPGQDVPYAADGQPTSRHTYDYVQYVPAIDSFCSFGGAAFYLSGQTGTSHTDCYNFATSTWQQHADDPTLGSFIGSFSAVDPVTGHAWAHGCGGLTSIAELDPVADAWISHGGMWTDQNNYYNYYLVAAVEPARRLLVAVGESQAFTFDLSDAGTLADAGDVVGVPLTTTGDQTIVNANAPGFEFDPVSHLFVAWQGGADVWTLDPATWAWTQVPPAPSNTVTPTAAAANGTNGRFRYSPGLNLFVVVNSVDEDVYVYRFTNDAGTPPPSVQFTAHPASVAAGGTSQLTWSSANASTCSASGGWSGSVATSGTQTVGPLLATTSFQLTCSGAAGVGGSVVTVDVLSGDGGTDAGTPRDGGATAADAGGADAGGSSGGRASGGCSCGGAPSTSWTCALLLALVATRSLRRRRGATVSGCDALLGCPRVPRGRRMRGQGRPRHRRG